MTICEIITIIISIISAIIAIISICLANNATKRANDIAEDQKLISHGQIELQIHQMISATKKDLIDIALKLQDGDTEILKQAFETARELNLNAYDEACAKYLDGKVDKERFKKNYHVEIRQLVEDKNNREKFDPIKSRYKCILKVYKEWNDLEKNP